MTDLNAHPTSKTLSLLKTVLSAVHNKSARLVIYGKHRMVILIQDHTFVGFRVDELPSEPFKILQKDISQHQ